MENPRDLLLYRIRQNKNECDLDTFEKSYEKCILSSVIDSMFYTICDYITKTRSKSQYKMGNLEIEYHITEEFYDSEDPIKYIEDNRSLDDVYLIMYVYDNFGRMELSSHRRLMLYFMNMLYFGL